MSSQGTARLNWLAVTLLASAAMAIGVAPAAWLVHRPWLALWFGCGAAILALLAPRKLTRPMTPAEYALEFGQLLALASVIGAVWMALYGALFGAGTLIHWLSRKPSVHDPSHVAFVGSLWPAAVLALFMAIGLWDDVRKRMALPSEGGEAWYPVLAKMDWGAFWVVVAFLGLPIVLIWFVRPSVALMLAQFALIAIPGQFKVVESAESRGADAIARLFEACGYSVTRQPRIGDEEVDRLLKPINLFAVGKASAFAVRVVTRDGRSSPADWTVASTLRAAASLYASKPLEVRCLVVLLGENGDVSLKDFGVQEGVQVLEFPDGEIARRSASTDNLEALRKLAKDYLHLQPEPQKVEAHA